MYIDGLDTHRWNSIAWNDTSFEMAHHYLFISMQQNKFNSHLSHTIYYNKMIGCQDSISNMAVGRSI